ncbi:MAG: GNAT family N-acetyltransferase [Alphaproteobacteria bacterium]
MRIETDRLTLRQFTSEDYATMASINGDPKVMECFPAPMTAQQSDAMMKRIEEHWQTNNFGLFALEIRDTGQLIGFTGLTHPPYETTFTPCIEVGWRLTPEVWGKGFAFEAATACLNWGFTDLGLNEIVSFTFEGNTRSRHLMARLGMAHTPNEDFDHPMLPPDSPLLRHVLYRLALDQGAPSPR